jgi:Phage head-tail joining protein
MIGQFRHRVTLDVPAGEDGYTPLNPPDWDCALQQDTMNQTTFVGRYHPGITTATRVHHQGRIFHVDAVHNREGRDIQLVVTCREVFD